MEILWRHSLSIGFILLLPKFFIIFQQYFKFSYISQYYIGFHKKIMSYFEIYSVILKPLLFHILWIYYNSLY